MRWEALFADLEAQLEAAGAADLVAQVADLTRAERAPVHLAGRLRAARGSELSVHAGGAEAVRGTVLDVADQWILLGDGPRRALIPLAAVEAVAALPASSEPAVNGRLARRLGLGHALRALARDRAVVRVATGGPELVGRLEGVGADHVDLTATDHAADRGRRPVEQGSGRPLWTIPLAAIRVVRSG